MKQLERQYNNRNQQQIDQDPKYYWPPVPLTEAARGICVKRSTTKLIQNPMKVRWYPPQNGLHVKTSCQPGSSSPHHPLALVMAFVLPCALYKDIPFPIPGNECALW